MEATSTTGQPMWLLMHGQYSLTAESTELSEAEALATGTLTLGQRLERASVLLKLRNYSQNGPNPKRPRTKRPKSETAQSKTAQLFGQNGPTFFFIRSGFNLRIWGVYFSKTSNPPPRPLPQLPKRGGVSHYIQNANNSFYTPLKKTGIFWQLFFSWPPWHFDIGDWYITKHWNWLSATDLKKS